MHFRLNSGGWQNFWAPRKVGPFLLIFQNFGFLWRVGCLHTQCRILTVQILIQKLIFITFSTIGYNCLWREETVRRARKVFGWCRSYTTQIERKSRGCREIGSIFAFYCPLKFVYALSFIILFTLYRYLSKPKLTPRKIFNSSKAKMYLTSRLVLFLWDGSACPLK